jgi:hypothetical protein
MMEKKANWYVAAGMLLTACQPASTPEEKPEADEILKLRKFLRLMRLRRVNDEE